MLNYGHVMYYIDIYVHVYTYYPIRGYSEGFLPVERRPMRVGQDFSKPTASQGSDKCAFDERPLSIPTICVTRLHTIAPSHCKVVTRLMDTDVFYGFL